LNRPSGNRKKKKEKRKKKKEKKKELPLSKLGWPCCVKPHPKYFGKLSFPT
jgi:hypothetical protein